MGLLNLIIPSIIYYSNVISTFFANYENGFFVSFKKLTHDVSSDLNRTNLVIVAHPDDDMLWFGDFIINNAPTTKVLCITNADNNIRSTEFIKVMNALNVSYEMWDYIDTNTHLGSKDLEMALINICDKYDKIYTHSLCGETGHPQHVMLHDYIYSIASEKLYVFSPKQFSHAILTDKKKDLLKFYISQKNVIQKHIYLSARENHVKI